MDNSNQKECEGYMMTAMDLSGKLVLKEFVCSLDTEYQLKAWFKQVLQHFAQTNVILLCYFICIRFRMSCKKCIEP